MWFIKIARGIEGVDRVATSPFLNDLTPPAMYTIDYFQVYLGIRSFAYSSCLSPLRSAGSPFRHADNGQKYVKWRMFLCVLESGKGKEVKCLRCIDDIFMLPPESYSDLPHHG